MLKRLVLHMIDREEKRLGQSLDYVRFIVRASLRAFRAFARIFGIAAYRRTLPPGPLSIARVVGARSEDCGTCLQVALNIARAEGVPREVLQAAIDRRPEDLPEDLSLVYRFAEGVTGGAGAEGELRAEVVRRFGDEGLVEIALAIASARFFPSVKRVLGYATACAKVRLEC